MLSVVCIASAEDEDEDDDDDSDGGSAGHRGVSTFFCVSASGLFVSGKVSIVALAPTLSISVIEALFSLDKGASIGGVTSTVRSLSILPSL